MGVLNEKRCKNYNKFETGYKYTSTTGMNDISGIIVYSKNDETNRNIHIL